MTGEKRVLPSFEGLRFFLAKGAGLGVSLVWVDHEASCHEAHELEDDGSWRRMDWHTCHAFDEEFGRWYPVAIRCPMTLGAEIRNRLEENVPAGHARARWRSEMKAARE